MSHRAATASPSATQGRWLFGPAPDLLLGCGLGYMLLFVAMSALGVRMTQIFPIGLLPLVLLVSGTPHYGATLLRVYEQRESRRKYAFFAVGITIALAVAFLVATYWHPLGSALLTVYFDWNPWHYAGQNYGIALMFLHRRGVEVSPRAKRLLYVSFLLSFLLAFVEMNGAARGAIYAVDTTQTTAMPIGPVYRFIPLGIPAALQSQLTGIGMVAYLATLAGAFALFARAGRLRDLGPSLLIVASQSLWFVIPVASRIWGFSGDLLPFSKAHFHYAFLWVAVGHSVQYLWITTYYARREAGFGTTPSYLLRCVLAGAVVWNLPAFVFAPALLGTVAYSDGLRLLVAAVVNLHHFILDGAIWKLRDTGVARILLRPTDAGRPEPLGPQGRSWLRPLVWVAGVACVGIAVLGTWEREFGIRQAGDRGDLARVLRASRRLAWIGQDEASIHRYLGQVAAKRGRPDDALVEFEKSLVLREHPKAWFEKGHIHAARDEWEEAAKAYAAAYAIDPYPVALVSRYAHALVRTGRLGQARQVLQAGLEQHPGQPTLEKQLGNVERLLER